MCFIDLLLLATWVGVAVAVLAFAVFAVCAAIEAVKGLFL